MLSDPVIAVPAPPWIQKQEGFFPSHNRERWLHPSLRICTSLGQHTRADPVVRDGEEPTLKTELKFPSAVICLGVVWMRERCPPVNTREPASVGEVILTPQQL